MCALAIPPAVQAQSTQSSESEDGAKLLVSLDRIREGLEREPKLMLDFLDPSITVFRTSVHENGIKLEDYWKIGPDTAVSRMVRPSHASRWHHDFLMMTTPKDYLATVPMQGNPVHPVGPPVLAISKALKQWFNHMERGQIRRQIQEELKEIEANNSEQARQTPAREAEDSKKTDPNQPAPKQPAPRTPNDPR